MDGDGTEVVLEASSIRQTKETSVEGRRKSDDVPSKHRYINSPERYRQPLSTIFFSQEEDYSKRLPRNSRKKKIVCLGFSCWSWLFLTAAFIQAALVVGIQVAIAVLGNFRSGRLDEYVDCFERSIGYGSGNELPANITFPTFGRDKEIYVYFFIALVVYGFCLCLYALRVHNIVEVYMFLIINVLATGYAALQVFQFRGFGDECDPITTVGYLALANVCVLIIFTVLFVAMSRTIYIEFGWKIYTRVGCNSDLRWYYRVYEVFMSGVKLLILFLQIFFVGQCILLLYVDENNINYEFWIVVFFLIPVTFASYPFTYWTVRNESIIGSIILFIADLIVIAYTVYKIYRYVTRSCPLCIQQVKDLEEEEEIIELQLNTTDSSTAREIIDRIEQFEHLVLLGVINFLTAVLVLFVSMYLIKQYGKGLKEYFALEKMGGGVFTCCKSSRGEYDITDQPRPRGVFLNLKLAASRGWSDKVRRKSSSNINTRSSDIGTRFDNRAMVDFKDAAPTTTNI